MRELTVRGRCFLAAGVAAVICGIQVGERDFVRIGLLAVLVPVLARLLSRRTDPGTWARRRLCASQVEAGTTTEVQVTVGNPGRRTGRLLAEEELPQALGGRRRFNVEALPAGGRTQVRYLLEARERGRYRVGPLHLSVVDPLGMVDLRRVVPSATDLLVTPRTETLPRTALTGRWAGAGDHRTRDLIGTGTPDVTIREYRLGDDLRRIHWPSSARVDALMVRREEQQWQSRCTLLLDNRRLSHRGYGPSSSLESAVEAAASISRHLVAQDFEVRLVSANGDVAVGGREGVGGMGDLLERLALMGGSRTQQLATGWVDENQQGGLLVAVLGDLQGSDRAFLGGLAAAGGAAYAVVLDVAQWDRSGRSEPPATAALRARGWKAATLARGAQLAPAWTELAR